MNLQKRRSVPVTIAFAIFVLVAVFAISSSYAATNALVDSGKRMSARELKAKLDKGEKVIILDARTEVGEAMIKGAVHVPVDNVEEWAKTADKNALIVTYCTCPHDEAADEATEKLRDMGFAKTFSLTGGLKAAREAGIPMDEQLK